MVLFHLRVWSLAALACYAALSGAAPFDNRESARVDYTKARHAPRLTCRDLLSWTDATLSVVSAREIDGGCRVTGIVPSEIRFEVMLPDAWNGRMMMTGNGGLAGQPLENAGYRAQRERALALGFATAYTDTGHDSRVEPGASFAHASLHKLVDYGYRGVHLTNQAARRIIKGYYRRGPRHSYFMGCSNGGRQAMMTAQRFPEDVDGIRAGAPANDFTGLKFSQGHRMQAMAAAPFDVPEVVALGERIYALCDARDGLEDGLIDDPRECDFDPVRDLPHCAGADQTGCFDTAELDALKRFYAPVVLAGERVYPAFPVGSEGSGPQRGFEAPGWVPWVINPNGRPILDVLGSEFFRYIVFTQDRPDFNWIEFDFNVAPDNLVMARDLLDAVDPDLGRFRAAGGKLLSYFGWADPDINPIASIEHHAAVDAQVRGEVDDFYRLFLVPGMFHCGGGPGPTDFDAMSPLIDWVEKGVAPASIEARHLREGSERFSRPLCPHPQRARWDGKGEMNSAASFACAL